MVADAADAGGVDFVDGTHDRGNLGHSQCFQGLMDGAGIDVHGDAFLAHVNDLAFVALFLAAGASHNGLPMPPDQLRKSRETGELRKKHVFIQHISHNTPPVSTDIFP